MAKRRLLGQEATEVTGGEGTEPSKGSGVLPSEKRIMVVSDMTCIWSLFCGHSKEARAASTEALGVAGIFIGRYGRLRRDNRVLEPSISGCVRTALLL